jgi:hypothetical protein
MTEAKRKAVYQVLVSAETKSFFMLMVPSLLLALVGVAVDTIPHSTALVVAGVFGVAQSSYSEVLVPYIGASLMVVAGWIYLTFLYVQGCAFVMTALSCVMMVSITFGIMYAGNK